MEQISPSHTSEGKQASCCAVKCRQDHNTAGECMPSTGRGRHGWQGAAGHARGGFGGRQVRQSHPLPLLTHEPPAGTGRRQLPVAAHQPTGPTLAALLSPLQSGFWQRSTVSSGGHGSAVGEREVSAGVPR